MPDQPGRTTVGRGRNIPLRVVAGQQTRTDVVADTRPRRRSALVADLTTGNAAARRGTRRETASAHHPARIVDHPAVPQAAFAIGSPGPSPGWLTGSSAKPLAGHSVSTSEGPAGLPASGAGRPT